ncbi:hypothetical protein BH11BAC2_BH11BAC2_11860 [soil metagenome]
MQNTILKSLLFALMLMSYDIEAQQCFDCGEGRMGAFKATHDTTILGGNYDFSSFIIDPGVTVKVSGKDPLVIRSKNQVSIAGILDASGQDGTNGVTGMTGGTGGNGFAGAYNGGNGVFTSGTSVNGVNGFGPGAGYFGAGWTGGGGAGYATTGGSASASSGLGGINYGDQKLIQLIGGSGGGSGASGFNCGSGGGGAGGGVIVIFTCQSISVTLTGAIYCNGGNGGSDGNGNCGGGGGGSGGTIWLGGEDVWVAGQVKALGGNGGSSAVPGNPYFGNGAMGSNGRIRIDYKTKQFSGTINPASGFTTTPFIVSIYRSLNTRCYGSATGYAKVRANGGALPYSYSWSTGSISNEIKNLSKGTYTVTVTDGNGCSQSETVQIEDPKPLNTWSEPILPSCAGGNDGALFTGAYGGTPFPKNSTLGTALFSNANAEGVMFNIQMNRTVDILKLALVLDEGQTHDIVVYYKAGKYAGFEKDATAWTNLGTYSVMGLGTESATFIVFNTPLNVSSGDYSFYVYSLSGKINTLTPAALGSSSIFDHCMTLYEGVGRDANTDPFQANQLSKQYLSGFIRYVINNPSGDRYNYLWNTNSGAHELKNIASGNYPLTVSDAFGCSSTFTKTLPDANKIDIVATTLVNPDCNGRNNGFIAITPTGGNTEKSIYTGFSSNLSGAGLMFDFHANQAININRLKFIISDTSAISVWYKTGSYVGNENNQSAWTLASTQVINPPMNEAPSELILNPGINILQGDYALYIANTNGTIKLGSGNVAGQIAATTNEIDLFSGTIRSAGNTSFNTLSEGVGIYTGSIGYTYPNNQYTYLWDNGSVNSSLSNLSSGDYQVKVKDIGGCAQKQTFHIIEPAPIQVNSTIVSEVDSLENGSAEINIIGGAEPYYIYWPATGTTGAQLNNVPSGNYSVLVVDANGCTGYGSATVDRILSHSIPDAILVLNPVPTMNWVKITKPISGMENCRFQMYDDNGRLVLNLSSTVSILMQEGISLENYRDGMYNVVVSDEDQRYTTKIVIIK